MTFVLNLFQNQRILEIPLILEIRAIRFLEVEVAAVLDQEPVQVLGLAVEVAEPEAVEMVAQELKLHLPVRIVGAVMEIGVRIQVAFVAMAVTV